MQDEMTMTFLYFYTCIQQFLTLQTQSSQKSSSIQFSRFDRHCEPQAKQSSGLNIFKLITKKASGLPRYARNDVLLNTEKSSLKDLDVATKGETAFEIYTQHHQLQLAFSTFLPKEMLPFLQTHLLLQRHLIAKRYLLTIVAELEKVNISYVILKGIPLNQQLYGNQCIRISKDIDLLIPLSKLELAHHCLIGLGFQLISEFSPELLTQQRKKIYVGLKDLTYRHSKFLIEIELHWRTTITRNFGFDFADIEAYRQTISIENKDLFVLKNEYNFVYLCIHGAISHWRRLKWLVDIAVFSQKQTFSWEEMLKIAEHHHARRCVYEACELLADMGVHLPAMNVRITDRLAVFIHIMYIRRLWRSCSQSAPIEQLFQLLLHPCLKQKFNFFCNRLLFRAPCRKKLLNNPRYPLWKLAVIGLVKK
jgi:hypothetical protein